MKRILYDQETKIGEVANWEFTLSTPVHKNVLGKLVLMPATKDMCSFVTPKPVSRKTKLTIIENQAERLELEIKSVKGMTVTAAILSRTKI